MDRVLNIIKGLKKLGPRIALDDFGTGYSSLNYIKQLPLNIIKVDKTFIDDIVGDDYAQAFVKLIVDLSKTIGTQIVVEGVEHSNQYELLRELGADYILESQYQQWNSRRSSLESSLVVMPDLYAITGIR